MNKFVSIPSYTIRNRRRFFSIVLVGLVFIWCDLSSLSNAQSINYDLLYTLESDDAGENFGSSVSNAGDVNNDGVADIIIGARGARSKAGMARVFSGITGAELFTFRGGASEDQFGLSVSGAGDVNGDGFADVLVGAPRDDNNLQNSGSAQVFSGFDGTTLYTFNGGMPGADLGQSVSSVGDVNRDGFADILVGSPDDHLTGGLNGDGSATVLSGNGGAVIFKFRGGFRDQDNLGSKVGNAGDVNNDGFTDFIVGATFDRSASVYSGQNGALLYKFFGSNFVTDVNGAGDINGDGFDDLIVGTEAFNPRVFSGFDGSILHTLAGDRSDQIGHSVSGAGDVDVDGFGDLLVGAPGTAGSSGAANLYSGRDGSLIYTFLGDSEGDLFGISVSYLGDINNDGRPDFVVGANGGGSENGGYAKVFVSAPEPLLLGDVNLDRTVDFLDISPFISVLSTGDFQAEADCDEDGQVDFLDISPFIAILSGS